MEKNLGRGEKSQPRQGGTAAAANTKLLAKDGLSSEGGARKCGHNLEDKKTSLPERKLKRRKIGNVAVRS